MLAILIALDCYRIGWVAWGLQRITDSQSTLQSEKSPYNPQNPLTIENRVIKDCGRILGFREDHYSTLFSSHRKATIPEYKREYEEIEIRFDKLSFLCYIEFDGVNDFEKRKMFAPCSISIDVNNI